MIRVEHLEKKLSNKTILKDISFHLPKGYICGLIGENGAGKTSLFRAIMGLYETEGSIRIDGNDILEKEAEAKECLGIIAEEAGYEGRMSLEQIGIVYGDMYKQFSNEEYLRKLDRFKLDRKQNYKSLSKGMKLKVQLAFALSHNAKLFLFDEPTAGLDYHFRQEFLEICTDLVSDGEKSVIISSHITEDLDRIADYIAFMQNGKMLFFMPKEDLCDRFLIVSGEDYKCNLIEKEALVYKEKGAYSTSAMVVNRKRFSIDERLEKRRPDIREFMHYFVKGGKENAEAIAEKYLES